MRLACSKANKQQNSNNNKNWLEKGYLTEFWD
jgi:hypothetical protein